MRIVSSILFYVVVFSIVFNSVAYGLRRRWLRRSSEISYERLPAVHAFWAFVAECAWLAVAIASLPFALVLGRRRGNPTTKGSVVLVHGWGMNRACFFLMERRLQRDGWGPILLFDYFSHTANIENASAKLAAFLREQDIAAHAPVTLIGHSLGGLVVRHCARHHGPAGVRRIFTLGSPHYGTRLANLIGITTALAPGSGVLAALNQDDDLPEHYDVISISSQFDGVIVPPSNAVYPKAFNIQLNDVGHTAMLFDAKVYQLIRENLEAPLAANEPAIPAPGDA